jgi:hypothetical protein
MASLKFYNTATGQWEAIKTDAINGVIPNNQTWTATQGQTTFTIPNGTVVDSKLISVFVDGKARTDFTMPNNTTIQFLTGISSGLQVYAQWFEASVPVTAGHHSTHELFGNDAIDVTKLVNYAEQIQTPIITLQNHASNTNNPHNVTATQVGAYNKTEVDNLFKRGYLKYTNGNDNFNINNSNTWTTIFWTNGTYGYDASGCHLASNGIVIDKKGIYFFTADVMMSGLSVGKQYVMRYYVVDSTGNVKNDDENYMLSVNDGLWDNNEWLPIHLSDVLKLDVGDVLQIQVLCTEAPRGFRSVRVSGIEVGSY